MWSFSLGRFSVLLYLNIIFSVRENFLIANFSLLTRPMFFAKEEFDKSESYLRA
jgi:hypothetical protein